MIVIKGIAASPGIAIGKAYVMEDEEIVVNRIELPRELLRAGRTLAQVLLDGAALGVRQPAIGEPRQQQPGLFVTGRARHHDCRSCAACRTPAPGGAVAETPASCGSSFCSFARA